MSRRAKRAVLWMMAGVIIFDSIPSDADRLLRRSLYRRFPDQGWCPSEGIAFVADSAEMTIRLTVASSQSPWFSKRIDDVYVVEEEVFLANIGTLDSPAVGDSQCVYSQSYFIPPDDPDFTPPDFLAPGDEYQPVFSDRFPDVAGQPKWHPGWQGVTKAVDEEGNGAPSQVFWVPASSVPDLDSGAVVGGSLGLEPDSGGGATTSVTISGLATGQTYVLSNWWYLGGQVLTEDQITIAIASTRFGRGLEPVDREFRENVYRDEALRSTPAIASTGGGEFVIAWDSGGQYDYPSPDRYGIGIRTQRHAADGTETGFELSPSGYDYEAGDPSVAMDAGGNFIVAWYDVYPSKIEGQLFDAGGNSVGGSFRVNDFTTDTVSAPSVAMDGDGDFVVAWESQGTYAYQATLRGQLFDPFGTEVGDEFLVGAYIPKSPAVATTAEGDFIVAWHESLNDGSGASVSIQRFDANANRVGDELRVNSYTTGNQHNPALAVGPGGELVVVWESDGSGGSDSDSFSIQGQLFAADGSAAGDQFQVNSYTREDQKEPAVAFDPSGEFLVVWTSDANVRGQQFAADGSRIAEEFRVNFFDQDRESAPAVAGVGGGEFVVTWSSRSQVYVYGNYGTGGEVDTDDVRVRRFAPATLQPPLFTDFEIGLDGFLVANDAGDGNGLWHLTDGCEAARPGHSASTALYFGVEPDCHFDAGVAAEGEVVSPEVELPATSPAILLRLNYLLQTEGRPQDGFDVVEVAVSADGGPFVAVAHNDPAQAGVRLVDAGPGVAAEDLTWQPAEVDLSAYAGSRIRLRFRFRTGDAVVNDLAGFYVDDVRLFFAGGVCPGADAGTDGDGDGTPDACDLCPAGSDVADLDNDGTVDGCDFCLGDNASGDGDGDGVCADLDCDDGDGLGVVCPLFSDGFESGDVSAWSGAVL